MPVTTAVENVGFVIYLLALSYAMGQLWYSIYGRHVEGWMRLLSFPLLGIIGGETLWVNWATLAAGPDFFGIHVVVAFFGTLVATAIDMLIHVAHRSYVEMERPAERPVRA